MIGLKKALALLTGALAVTAYGITNDRGAENRNYRVIVDRNPFGLKPLPPLPTNAPPPAPPKDEIFLTGMTSIGGLRAYFMTKAPQGKQPEFYSLRVDDEQNGLKVLAIDLTNKSVRVRNGGAESLMTFAANGVKPPVAPATPPPAVAGVPQPPGAFGAPGAATMPGGMAASGGAVTAPTTTAGGIRAGTPGTTTSGRIRTIPSRNVRTPPSARAAVDVNQPMQPPDPNAGVQDVLIMELQKRTNPDIVYPPTPVPFPQ
jgi:hypothetical protein